MTALDRLKTLMASAFNLRHDAPTRDLVDRPIALTTILPTTWFESGAGFHGKIPIGDTHRVGYELYLVNGLDARIFDGFGLRAARGSHFEDNNKGSFASSSTQMRRYMDAVKALSAYSSCKEAVSYRSRSWDS